MNRVIAEVFERYPQMGLPIIKGSKETPALRSAVFAGEPVETPAENFLGHEADSFTAVSTPAGEVSVLYLVRRDDFETAVRCLSAYCEPIPVPASMGAQMISGLINWKKINDHRQAYLDQGGTRWDEEFTRFTSVRENFRDSVILLSSGSYSAVPAGDAAKALGRPMSEEEWRERSGCIRKYHELTHFIARKLFPDHKEAIRDEIVADAVGLISSFGKYETGLAALFLGLENETYRDGGRLEIYYGKEEDPAEVQRRARKLIETLASFLEGEHSTSPEDLFRLVCRIEEEKAGMGLADHAEKRLLSNHGVFFNFDA